MSHVIKLLGRIRAIRAESADEDLDSDLRNYLVHEKNKVDYCKQVARPHLSAGLLLTALSYAQYSGPHEQHTGVIISHIY